MRRARLIHVTDESTASALAKRKTGKTLRVLACDLGEPRFSIATLSAVLRNKPGTLTMTSEDDLRQRLGLPAISPHIMPACPSCGGAHVLADCHGAPVAEIVALAPDERIVKRRPPRPRRTTGIGGLHPETRARHDARRRANGQTWEAYLTWLDELVDGITELPY